MPAIKSGRRRYCRALLWLALLFAPVVHATLTATLDRSSISMGETARLVISSDGDADPADADLSGLQQHFDILQRSSSMSTQIINGQREQRRELVLEITPRAEGEFTIGPFAAGAERSLPLSVSVGAAPQLSIGDEVVLFDAEVDRTEVYVQGQLLLTLRVQQAVNLDSRSISELELDDAVVKTLGQNSFQRTVDGRPWLVHEIRVAIFPQSSGELRIPAQTFSGRLSSGRRSLFDMRSSGRLLTRKTEELVIDVAPRPAGYSDPSWLPAAQLTLEEQWSADPTELRVGDSITRSVTVTAAGLQGTQLPPMDMAVPEGLRVYPDQPTINELDGADGVTGMRTDSLALVAVRAGDYALPPLTLRWWDTNRNELREETLPGRRIRVLPAAPAEQPGGSGPVAAAVPEQPQSAGGPAPWWPWITAFCALGWAATAVLAVRRQPRTPAGTPPRDQGSRRDVLAACAAHDPVRAQRALRQWLAHTGHRGTIDSWRRTQASAELDAALQALDSHLYGSGTEARSWDGSALAAALRSLDGGTVRQDSDAAVLPPLHPTAT